MNKIFLIIIMLATYLFLPTSGLLAENLYIFSPRVWFSNFSLTFKEGGWNEDQNYKVKSDSIMFGGTLVVTPRTGRENNLHIINIFTGDIDDEHDYLGGGDYKAQRFDIEYLFRKIDSNFDILYGARTVSYKSEKGGTLNEETSTFFLLGEFGLGKNIALTDNSYLLGNLVFSAGFDFWREDYKTESESSSGSELSIFYDLSIGYAYQINESFAAGIRYRILANPPIGNVDISIDGLEISISYAFL